MARKKQKQDEAHDETDRIIEETERKIHKEYAKAEKELKQKVEAFFEKFDAEDEEKRQQLANGEITEDYYRKWRTTRMATGQRWEDMRQIIAEDMTNANNLARSTINGHAADVYALNRNFATYQVEKEARINTSFTLYNRRAVENLMNNDESLLPAPREGSRAWQAMMNKDLRWNQQKINSSLIQGILQGDSIPEISERLLSIVGNNEVSARRSARTMMTFVENKARDDSYEELKSKGVELETIWLATLDDRTRHSHRQLHGEARGENGRYSNGLRFPADPSGAPEEVYNCRCCEISHVKGYPIDIPKWSEKWDDDMTFEAWQGAQERQSSEPKQNHEEVNGKDITESFVWDKNKFDFEIDAVLDAQGFNGLPKVAEKDEFDELVKKANEGNGFIAQRAYSAPTKEALDEYQNQLYNGKWYVDCSNGTAAYGQGMYGTGDFTGKRTGQMEDASEFYAERFGKDRPFKIEEFTLTSDAKMIGYDDLYNDFRKYTMEIEEKNNQIRNTERKNANVALAEQILQNSKFNGNDDAKTFLFGNLSIENVDWKEMSRIYSELGSETNEITKLANLFYSEQTEFVDKYVKEKTLTQIKDIGSYAAAKGYDGIKVTDRGIYDTTEVVILNRTKVIFKGD